MRVYSYIEVPSGVKKLFLAESEDQARRELFIRGVTFRNLTLDVMKTLKLLAGGSLFSAKDYIRVLRTIARYLRNGADIEAALETLTYSPEESVSLLASLLLDRMSSGKKFSEAVKGIFPEEVCSVLSVVSVKPLHVIESVIKYLESEEKAKKGIRGVLLVLKTELLLSMALAAGLITYVLPKLYDSAVKMNPHADYGLPGALARTGSLFRDHLYISIPLFIVVFFLVYKGLTEERLFRAFSKIPRMRVVDTLDKRTVVSYALLFLNLNVPVVGAAESLWKVVRLPKIREKLRRAYAQLLARPGMSWGDFFEVADIDRLITMKTKASPNIEEELQMLVQDFDEYLEEQIAKISLFVQITGVALLGALIGILLYSVIVFLAPT